MLTRVSATRFVGVVGTSGLAMLAAIPPVAATTAPGDARAMPLVATAAARSLPSTPVGDGRRSRVATRGAVLTCESRPLRRSPVPWVVAGTFVQSRQPRVAGAERPAGGSSTTVSLTGRQRVLRGSGVPSHPVGAFRSGLTAAPFAVSVAANPRVNRTATCLPSGAVGVLLSGAPLYSPMDASGRDTLAHALWDRCDGAPDALGRYRYVRVSSCLPDRNRGPSRLLGYALDGFGIYGPRDERGRVLTNADLDACHGRVGPVVWNGRRVLMYHYVATAEFPYTLGCFRGAPSTLLRATGRTPAPVAPPAAPGTPTTPPLPSEPPVPPVTPPPVTPPPPVPPLRVSSPSMVPTFDREVTDYTVRCDGGSTTLSVADVPTGLTVAVDGGPASAGDRDVVVPLAEGQRFDWSVADASGTTTHHARCLPADFPLWTTERAGTPQAQWYVFSSSLAFGASDPGLSSYVSVVDGHGVPVWWAKETRGLPLDGKILGPGQITWTIAGTAFALYGSYDVRGWDGSVVTTVGGRLDHHDLIRTERGTYLGLVYVVRPCDTEPSECVDVTGLAPGIPAGDTAAAIIDGEVQEYSAAGDLLWSWSSRGHIDLAETGRWYTAGARIDGGTGPAWYDVIHLNSVEDDGDGVIVSARHTDAVYRIRKDTGEIDWKLGGMATARSLAVTGMSDPSDLFGGQHDARRLADGSITVHDNATGRNRPPRAIRFSIDPVRRTATVIESVADPRAPDSLCCGSSRRLPTGNWVSAWGANGFVTEQAPDGTPVLTMRFSGSAFSYRVAPAMPGVVQSADLRDGMDAMHPRPVPPQP